MERPQFGLSDIFVMVKLGFRLWGKNSAEVKCSNHVEVGISILMFYILGFSHTFLFQKERPTDA